MAYLFFFSNQWLIVGLAAAKSNGKDFADLRVYGLLTDNSCFHFYSYDPVTESFAFDKIFIVNITISLI